jgi:ATPase subunit of ABC transporter with duplicated ATPase domains
MTIKNLTIKHKNESTLIENLSFSLNKGDKLCIIGEEGNGKSTLLKVLAGLDLDYITYSGHIEIKEKLGYLPQLLEEVWKNETVLNFLLKEEHDQELTLDDYNKLEELMSYFSKFNLDESLLDQKMSECSGGEQVKIGLIKILNQHVDILLFDEPTNDLDLEAIEWIENFIKTTDIPIIFISHDETLLEECANRVLHLERLEKKTKPIHSLMNITYTDYVASRLNRISKQNQIASAERREHKKQMIKLNDIYNKVRHQQNQAVRNPSLARLLAKKMKNIKSQKKRFESTEMTQTRETEEAISVWFDDAIQFPKGKNLIHIEKDLIQREGKELIYHLDLTLSGNENKVTIIGQNGTGKTTLIKEIFHVLEQDQSVKVGYFPQDYQRLLKMDEKAIANILELTNYEHPVAKIKSYMGNMNITRDEMESNVFDLSGGTQAKIILLSLVLNESNVLILDEPTRNFSPLSNPVIRDILKAYNGFIISVSHDRKFITEVANSIYEIKDKQLVKHY